MSRNIVSTAAQIAVVPKILDKGLVHIREKGMKVGLIAFHCRPVGKTDAAFISGVTGGHPFTFGNTQPCIKLP